MFLEPTNGCAHTHQIWPDSCRPTRTARNQNVNVCRNIFCDNFVLLIHFVSNQKNAVLKRKSFMIFFQIVAVLLFSNFPFFTNQTNIFPNVFSLFYLLNDWELFGLFFTFITLSLSFFHGNDIHTLRHKLKYTRTQMWKHSVDYHQLLTSALAVLFPISSLLLVFIISHFHLQREQLLLL